MRAGTHIVAGVAVGYAVGASAGLDSVNLAALGALGGLCALIPDIDHPQSAIRRKTGLLGDLAGFWMKHRGITHTLLAAALFGLLCALMTEPTIWFATAGAYVSHLVLDSITPSGVPLFGPLSWRRFHLMPSGLRIRTGSFAEKGVLLALVAALYVSAWGVF